MGDIDSATLKEIHTAIVAKFKETLGDRRESEAVHEALTDSIKTLNTQPNLTEEDKKNLAELCFDAAAVIDGNETSNIGTEFEDQLTEKFSSCFDNFQTGSGASLGR